jgi:hypothetical protein
LPGFLQEKFSLIHQSIELFLGQHPLLIPSGVMKERFAEIHKFPVQIDRPADQLRVRLSLGVVGTSATTSIGFSST